PAASDWRERYGDLQLRIIMQPRPVIGISPAMIEHIFAHGMGFQIGWRGGGKTAARILDENMRAGPTGPRSNRFGGFERLQESIGDKRVEPLRFIGVIGHDLLVWRRRVGLWIGASVPLRSIDLAHRWRDMDRVGRRHR